MGRTKERRTRGQGVVMSLCLAKAVAVMAILPTNGILDVVVASARADPTRMKALHAKRTIFTIPDVGSGIVLGHVETVPLYRLVIVVDKQGCHQVAGIAARLFAHING